MSAISNFAVAQEAANVRSDASLGRIEVGVQALKDAVVAGITPEDAAILAAQLARSEALATRAEAVDVTVPTPPVV